MLPHLKKTVSQQIFDAFNIAFLGAFGLLCFLPFWYVLIASFNVGTDFTKGGVYLFPRLFTLENYQQAFKNKQIVAAFTVSVIRTASVVAGGLLVSALAAYAMHVRTLPGRAAIFMFFYIPTILSGGLIPYYILLRTLKLTSSILIYILPSIYGFFNIVLMRIYFDTNVPSDIREAASIDGASDLKILMRIYLPLATPVLATLALFIGVGNWNEWFTGAYFVSNKDLWPAATLLQKILNEAAARPAMSTDATAGSSSANMNALVMTQTVTSQSLQMAFVMILTMPIIVVYPFLQKYYVKGIMVGSIKG